MNAMAATFDRVKHETKYADLVLDAPTDLAADEGTISGYASLFDRVDLGNDSVEKGAFAKSLKSRGPKGVRMLFQHDPNEVIGTWQVIAEDNAGLRVKGRINTKTSRGRDVLELLRTGAIDGLSIGFKTVRAKTNKITGARHILEADLWEISVVTFPMLPEARISEVKNHHNRRQLPSVRQFEYWLTRDAGLTRGEAKMVIAQGFQALKVKSGFNALHGARDAAKNSTLPNRPDALAALIRKAAKQLSPRGIK